MTKPATEAERRIEMLTALTAYHAGPKVRKGIAFVAAPEPTPPKPVKPDPTSVGLEQAASAFFEISRIYKNLGD